MTVSYSMKFKSQGWLETNSFPVGPASSDTTVATVAASSNGYNLLVQSYSKAGTTTVSWKDQSGPQSVTVTIEAVISAGNLAVPGSPSGLKAIPGGLHLISD